MNRINVSKDEHFHTQRNNLEIPHDACFVTSMIMALKDLGIPFYCPGWMQPEDYLTVLLLSNTARQELRQVDRYAYDKSIPANLVHAMVSLYVNRMVGREVTRFVARGHWEQLLEELRAGRPAVVGTSLTPAGHVVEVVGLVEEDGRATHVIIDDPYGDPRTDYRDVRGNDVELDAGRFGQVWKGTLHVFRREGFAAAAAA